MRAFDKNTPYNNLPPLPPRMDIETKAVLRKTITAGRKLAEMNRALRTLPNPTLFIDTIYMQEARASSEVENIITTNDELYRSLVSDYSPEYAAAKEVLCYKEALWLGMRYIAKKPFITTNLCVSIVQCITGNTDSIRKLPGTTLSNTRGEVVYTPPTGEKLIRDKMARLEKFINTNDSLDPLIKMALMHYQFEAIHPFEQEEFCFCCISNSRVCLKLLLSISVSTLLEIGLITISGFVKLPRRVIGKSTFYLCWIWLRRLLSVV
jgi:Fic family protein